MKDIHVLAKNYRVIFKSSLIEGLIFFLLFVTGIARYRFSLVLITRGILSAVSQYCISKGSDSKISEYWPVINNGLLGLVVISVLLDVSKGQVYPKYADLPAWITVIGVGIGYSFILLLYIKGGDLVQNMSGGDIFTICPNCGFLNITIVEKCKKCGYATGMPLAVIRKEQKLPEELERERNEFERAGLYVRVPREIIASLRLTDDEYILITLKSPKYLGGKKDEGELPAGWLIFTNERIICLVGLKGWLIKEEVAYPEIKAINVITKQVLTTTRKSLELKTDKHTFHFLIGFTKADKILEGFLSFDISNTRTVSYLLNCIRKHAHEIPNK